MQVVLLYPPPFAIPPFGQLKPPQEALPPSGWHPSQPWAGDEISTPYGLLSIAAQLKAADLAVTVLNLYTFPWGELVSLLAHMDADIFGLSCLTANRRGVAAVARIIRRHHPRAWIVLGGPHVSALARETLRHWPWVNAVVVGEGEDTFRELVVRRRSRQSLSGLPGLVYRNRCGIQAGPPPQANRVPGFSHTAAAPLSHQRAPVRPGLSQPVYVLFVALHVARQGPFSQREYHSGRTRAHGSAQRPATGRDQGRHLQLRPPQGPGNLPGNSAPRSPFCVELRHTGRFIGPGDACRHASCRMPQDQSRCGIRRPGNPLSYPQASVPSGSAARHGDGQRAWV